ncbi:MAG TPA: hypothetical protein VF756_17500 [Thermoanaerobaculia bacterium]
MRVPAPLLGLLLLSGLSAPGAEATPLHPAFDLQGPGLTVAYAGVGLNGLGAGSRSLTVNVRNPIELALLYWAGREYPCPPDPDAGGCAAPEEPYKDQVLRFDGALIQGTLVGTETQPDANPGAVLNVGYMADVTEIVRAKGGARRVFGIADGDPTSNLSVLDGAGLLVVYTRPTGPDARVIVLHGLDFAYGEDRAYGGPEITEAATINHGASRKDRRGELVIFAGDALATAPDRIDIRHNPSLLDRLDGSAGAFWDADLFAVDIPGGSIATTVQIFSEPPRQNPDSLLWVMAALRIPLTEPTGCTPDLWSSRTGLWQTTGIRPTQLLRNIFTESTRYGAVGNVTILGALRFQEGGAGALGAAKTLLRTAAAALLNAAHTQLEYPRTRTQVITSVDTALRMGDAQAMLTLAAELDEANRARCPLR